MGRRGEEAGVDRASSRRRAKEIRKTRVKLRVSVILVPRFLVHELGDFRARTCARPCDWDCK